MGSNCTFRYFFSMVKKLLNLLKKKDTATILLQSTPYSTKMRALTCRLCLLVVEILGPLFWACLFFLTNYFKVKFYFFQKSKKYISKHFFYEKMVSVLFFFPLKKYIDHFFSHFQIRKKLPFLTFFDLSNPFMTSK